jgi:hypothetical protein
MVTASNKMNLAMLFIFVGAIFQAFVLVGGELKW